MTEDQPQHTEAKRWKHKVALGLAVAALLLGSGALLVSWLPYLSLLVIPLAGLSLVLAGLVFAVRLFFGIGSIKLLLAVILLNVLSIVVFFNIGWDATKVAAEELEEEKSSHFWNDVEDVFD